MKLSGQKLNLRKKPFLTNKNTSPRTGTEIPLKFFLSVD
jgi:hypothetical protein